MKTANEDLVCQSTRDHQGQLFCVGRSDTGSLFGEVPDIRVRPSGAMIIGAAIYVALREGKLAKSR